MINLVYITHSKENCSFYTVNDHSWTFIYLYLTYWDVLFKDTSYVQGLIQGYGQEGHGCPHWAKLPQVERYPQFWDKSRYRATRHGVHAPKSARDFTLATPMKKSCISSCRKAD